jgi:formate-nitrite transporter family protein
VSIQQRPDGAHELRVPVTAEDWSRGSSDAPVTVVEYADFECPDCRAAYPAVEALFAARSSVIRHVFRHFPLVSAHPSAMRAALAADAAGRQGKFWEMYARLYEGPPRLAEDDLIAGAEALHLDMERFHHDLDDVAAEAAIRQGKVAGARSGVNGTPTFFIGGVRYDGARTTEALQAAVDVAVAE